MDRVRAHVEGVGADAALAALHEEAGEGDGAMTRYAGAWEDVGEFLIEDYVEKYLDRHGIVLAHAAEASDPSVRTVSPQARAEPEAPGAGGFRPVKQTLRDKLAEAKALPGLESSEDLGVIMGRPVTHLTPEVMAKLDGRYGKGQWVVKSYSASAFAGFGVYFPQRAAALAEHARNAIWFAGEHLARYDLRLGRHPDTGLVSGLVHSSGDVYQFGTPEYERTIHGDARHWAEQARAAAADERGPALPEGGEKFMAQPAFPVVGVSDADRAAGRTHEGTGEGRTHIVTRNGKAELVPYSTWIKGEDVPVVFEDDTTRGMAKAALDAINALPESERQGQIYAPDVVRTAEGFRVVEANPSDETGGSGYLGDNPFIIDAYVSHVTGRDPAHVRFVRNLLTARAGGREAAEALDRRYGEGKWVLESYGPEPWQVYARPTDLP